MVTYCIINEGQVTAHRNWSEAADQIAVNATLREEARVPRYVMLWNGGLFHNDKNVFTLKEIKEQFLDYRLFTRKRIRNSSWFDRDDIKLNTLDELLDLMIEAGSKGSPHYIWEEDLAERGDDYVVASLVRIQG